MSIKAISWGVDSISLQLFYNWFDLGMCEFGALAMETMSIFSRKTCLSLGGDLLLLELSKIPILTNLHIFYIILILIKN